MSAVWIPKRLVDLSLINTRALQKQSFIRRCEYEYESRVYDAAKQIVADDKKIVMLTGPSASGKTTTAHKLKDKLINMGKNARVVSLDNFFKNMDDYPRLEDGSKDYENVTALELVLFEKCIMELITKGRASFPQFDFASETRTENAVDIQIDDGYIIVEGIHALNPLLLDLLPREKTFGVYAGLREEYSFKGQRVLSTRDIRLLRRMIRDHRYRGHSPQKTVDMWDDVCRGEDKYIKVYKPNADFILDTSFSYEILVMHSALNDFLSEAQEQHRRGQTLSRLYKVFDNIGYMPVGSLPANSMLCEFFN